MQWQLQLTSQGALEPEQLIGIVPSWVEKTRLLSPCNYCICGLCQEGGHVREERSLQPRQTLKWLTVKDHLTTALSGGGATRLSLKEGITSGCLHSPC